MPTPIAVPADAPTINTAELRSKLLGFGAIPVSGTPAVSDVVEVVVGVVVSTSTVGTS